MMPNLSNNIGSVPKNTDVDMSNSLQIGWDYILVISICGFLFVKEMWLFVNKIIKTENSIENKMRKIAKEEVATHTLEKKPKLIKTELKIDNIEKCIEHIKNKVDNRSDKTDKVLEKLADAFTKLGETLGQIDVRLARVETKLENK